MLRIKRAHTRELRDEIFALRYRAYRSEQAIEASPTELFEDAYDSQPNHVLWALTDEERVVGSIRTTWYDPDEPWIIPEMDGYAEDLARAVPPGSRLLSANRFVTDPDRAERNAQYALLLLRHYMVVAHLRAEWSIAAVRVNHLPFYRRVCLLQRVSDARPYPGLSCPMHLTACEWSQVFDPIYRNYPILRPRGYERLFLDEGYQDVWEIGLPVEV